MLGKKNGNIMMAVLASGAALGIVLLVSRFGQLAGNKRQSVANENVSRLVNEMVTSRVGQAIAATAILCSETKELCYWNEALTNAKPSDFRITSIKTSGDILNLMVESCLPGYAQDISFDNCKKVTSAAEVRFSSIDALQKANLIVGLQSGSDSDNHAALVSVATSFMGLNGQSKDFTSTSIIRRPRPYLRIEPAAGACKPTCAVSDGNKSQDFCYGKLKINNNNDGTDATKSAVKYRVHNDGPGYLYRFAIKRSFAPNATINASTKAVIPETVIYDSAQDDRLNGKQGKMGLAAGESIELSDDQLPCYDEKTFQTITNTITAQGGYHDGNATGQVMGVFDAGSSSSTREFSTNPRPSGEAEYSFKTVEPANALLLGQGGSAVPATQTLTTTIRTVIVRINTGMN